MIKIELKDENGKTIKELMAENWAKAIDMAVHEFSLEEQAKSEPVHKVRRP